MPTVEALSDWSEGVGIARCLGFFLIGCKKKTEAEPVLCEKVEYVHLYTSYLKKKQAAGA
jgi:hypothetical protein